MPTYPASLILFTYFLTYYNLDVELKVRLAKFRLKQSESNGFQSEVWSAGRI